MLVLVRSRLRKTDEEEKKGVQVIGARGGEAAEPFLQGHVPSGRASAFCDQEESRLGIPNFSRAGK